MSKSYLCPKMKGLSEEAKRKIIKYLATSVLTDENKWERWLQVMLPEWVVLKAQDPTPQGSMIFLLEDGVTDKCRYYTFTKPFTRKRLKKLARRITRWRFGDLS